MIAINRELTPADLSARIERMWDRSAGKIRSIEETCTPGTAAPVFTVEGRYTAQGWTEWTQGFQFGSALLQFDATGDGEFLEIGRRNTVERMSPHVTHTGVHDHGFNNVSTYGNLWRLMREGRIPDDRREREFYELALKASGAVQAARWTPTAATGGLFVDMGTASDRAESADGCGRRHEPAPTADGRGFISSFNGPHSLFSDTIRSLRVLALGHRLGGRLMAEHDEAISLLGRLIGHAHTTARYNVYYGEGRDAYDVPGRVAHESIFNTRDGRYRCPSTQQGYSPLTTWTRGLAWIMLGYAEQLEFLRTLEDGELEPFGGRREIEAMMSRAARASCDFYIEQTPADGVPYWDTGAPGLARLGDYLDRPADPFNEHEPVDSSAAAIAAQGLLRLGSYLKESGGPDDESRAHRYFQAGLTVLAALLEEPYLAADEDHQGLLLHAIYHRPRGWDHVPTGATVPRGESCLWGDYHLREAALSVQRLARGEPYYTFFGPVDGERE